MKRLSLILLLVFCTCSYCLALEKIVYCPHWLSQAQFAGFYVAQELGFYEQEGLDVEIRTHNVDIGQTQNFSDPSVDLCTLFLDQAIYYNNHEQEIVNIAQFSQHSSLVIVTHPTIKKLEKLHNKKIAIWHDHLGIQINALFKNRGITIQEWVKCQSGLNYFQIGAVSAMLTTCYNELFQVNNCGLTQNEFNQFWIKDAGFDFPEEGLYCLKKNYKPSYKRFVKASIKGWQYCRKNPQKALKIVYKKMYENRQNIRPKHQEWMLKHILQLQQTNILNSKSSIPYTLNEKQYEQLSLLMLHTGTIDSIVPYKNFVIQY